MKLPAVAPSDGLDRGAMLHILDKSIAALLVQLDLGNGAIHCMYEWVWGGGWV